MTKKLRLEFCNISVYDNYMIVEMDTGVHITLEANSILISLVNTYFKNKPFVYITHRVNSYSVDPAVYIETSKIKNLIGLCVVSKNSMAKSTAEIEKLFFNKSFEIFNTLTEAVHWANKTLA